MNNILVVSLSLVVLTINSSYADSENGKELANKNCVACHIMGDHEKLYTREKRLVTSYEKLKGQVSRCSQNLNLDLFPEDELDIASYLNEKYYHFKTKK